VKKKNISNIKEKKEINSEKEQDLEEEWKKMRKKLEGKLEVFSEGGSNKNEEGELEESLDEENSDEEFRFEQFISSRDISQIIERKVPILEKINLTENQEIPISQNFEVIQDNIRKEKETTVDYLVNSRRGGEGLYLNKRNNRNFSPKTIDPMEFSSDIFLRNRIFNSSSQMAGRKNEETYPEMLRVEQKEKEEDYYKSPEDSY
jgi:hypothetical protein